ncbi:phosphoribosylaminoimidazolesuccinocarboxamide synthase [Candidatus Poribacteria bacterium]|nr:MAG: phosphoribosylaminoimidazolesuccinocarboxamide synthase [Candidatus Poribacteria bacterium]
MSEEVLMETNLEGVKLFKRGKVRDIYDLGDMLLFVATDRISAFDYVLPNGIPYKGKVLTGLSAFWFEFTKDISPNHMITADVSQYPEELQKFADLLRGRSMLVRKAERIDIECVVRGYIAGSAWREYRESGTVCGMKLPEGLRESDKLPEPIFTPATKSETGHDENIPISKMIDLIGRELTDRIIETSLKLYRKAAEYAEGRGIIIADTKFEFGLIDGELVVIDEMLTPDSSRFWDKADYEPGRPQKSFDKQYVRDYLESIGWNKQPPVPSLPDEVVRNTSLKYLEAYRRITGRDLLEDHST